MRKILLYLFTFLPLSLLAGPTLDDLDIRVELMDNGNARITEVRRMAIDYEGTECYIVMGNLNGSTIRDFSVSDETGLMFTNVGEWDVDRSRSYKEGKCGIVTKSNGYELCWGLGDVGNRVYTVSYTVTDLVRAIRMQQRGPKLRYVTVTNAYWQLITNRNARIRQLKQLDDKMVAMTRFSFTDMMTDHVVATESTPFCEVAAFFTEKTR